ncbi:TIGR04211 family SH3 domain-containing protein [Pseudoalteromonas denitrificans]|uniref:SH3 domain protein n=1 Tax=Pseudoalteromonas denitrificans DSM 6059 TaxID=1123010 RepID=A0A1I1J8Z9_9GAMM|nr:TIGR04211 family SH3 domain-containing protein [Pseudoalteromonas denitrificans]SFC44601.1 SH3 domain protein [Pseudoalteromonas denitrificans DSM 6059]
MLKPIIFIITFLSLMAQVQAEEGSDLTKTDSEIDQKAYVIDSLYIYMHAGAGKNFRILGSINAGTELNLLEQNDDSGYSKVKDTKGRTGWIDKRFISKTPGLAFQNQELVESITNIQNELRNMQIQAPKMEQKSALLLTKNTELQSKINILQQKIDQQNSLKQATSEKEKKQLLLYGGGIAFTGLLIGVLLTLMLSRRKRTGWA